MNSNLLIFIALILICFACRKGETEEDRIVNGLKPIYLSSENSELKLAGVKNYEELGKIVSVGNILYLNDKHKGIHIVDNTSPENPIKRSFINIPGNTDFTIKGNYIYCNHLRDLVTLRFDGEQINEVSRLPNFYSVEDFPEFLYPSDDYFGYFECANNDLGFVVGWEQSELVNPKCRR